MTKPLRTHRSWRDIAKDSLINLARWDKTKKVMVDNYFVKVDGLRKVASELNPIKELLQSPQQLNDGSWICKTTIIFEDGSKHEGWASASFDNVSKNMKSYLLEMSCTRSEARVLRSALQIDVCSFEELHLNQEQQKIVKEQEEQQKVAVETQENKEVIEATQIQSKEVYLSNGMNVKDFNPEATRDWRMTSEDTKKVNEYNGDTEKAEKEGILPDNYDPRAEKEIEAQKQELITQPNIIRFGRSDKEIIKDNLESLKELYKYEQYREIIVNTKKDLVQNGIIQDTKCDNLTLIELGVLTENINFRLQQTVA